MRFSFANHSATCASTGMARTSFATAASNACCCENDGACFPCRARWIATRIARSMPDFSVIGAQANSVSGLVGIEKRSLVVRRSRIEPRLKLPARARKQIGELGGFYFQKREHFTKSELIEIKKRERAPLRFGRRGNPDGELIGFELRDLHRRDWGNVGFLHHAGLGLEALFADGQTTPARVAKKPEPVRRRLIAGGTQGRFSNCVLKSFLRFARIARHQKTKAIELRKILGGNRHEIIFSTRNLPAPHLSDKSVAWSQALRAVSRSRLLLRDGPQGRGYKSHTEAATGFADDARLLRRSRDC